MGKQQSLTLLMVLFCSYGLEVYHFCSLRESTQELAETDIETLRQTLKNG